MKTVLGAAALSAAIAAAAIAACGGKVVVDRGAGGANGAGAGATSGPTSGPGNTAQGTGGCFFVPPPVGSVNADTCGGSVGAGGAEPSCTTQCNDQDNHVYEVTCQGKACRCIYDGNTICTCAISGDASFCGGGASPCCPPPWIAF